MRVPLILRGPGAPAGERRDQLVSLVSLPATLLELLGLPYDAARYQGGSLVPFLRGEVQGPSARAFVEVDFVDRKHELKDVHKKGIVAGRWKCIRDDETGAVQLFDLEADPDEHVDLARERPDLVRELIGELDRHLASLATARLRPVETELSEEELQELSGLGYAGGGDGDESP